MKLYDYLKLCESGEEVTIYDNTIDCEMYFYNNEQKMIEISKKLEVTRIYQNGVEVDFYTLIENKLAKLIDKNLYNKNVLVEDVVDDLDKIFAGYVTEKWYNTFIEILIEDE